jgi:hypothetical protein
VGGTPPEALLVLRGGKLFYDTFILNEIWMDKIYILVGTLLDRKMLRIT